jgi:zinc transporter ZupT
VYFCPFYAQGLAVVVSALSSKKLGIIMTLGIAVHNIPEGLAIATPIFAATGDRRKAFMMAALSGARFVGLNNLNSALKGTKKQEYQ